MATQEQIENAILDATGRPDTGAIVDNLGAISAAVLRVVNPMAAPEFKTEKETRIVEAKETR